MTKAQRGRENAKSFANDNRVEKFACSEQKYEKTAKGRATEQAKNRQIATYIPLGKENAVTSGYLQAVLGTSARCVQQMIERARLDGHMIINDQNGRGYYISEDPDDWERQYWQDTNRALAILKRRKHLRKKLIEAGRDVRMRGERRGTGT